MKITNSELISNFIEGINENDHAANMSYLNRLDDRVLYSYRTPIAVYDKNNKQFLISKLKFSMTTIKQKINLYRLLNYNFIFVYDVRVDLLTNCYILYDEIIEEIEKLKRKRLQHTKESQKRHINQLIDNLQNLIKYEKIDKRISIIKKSMKLKKV